MRPHSLARIVFDIQQLCHTDAAARPIVMIPSFILWVPGLSPHGTREPGVTADGTQTGTSMEIRTPAHCPPPVPKGIAWTSIDAGRRAITAQIGNWRTCRQLYGQKTSGP